MTHSAAPRILVANPDQPAAFQAAIEEGAAIIRAGGLVAFPTETVYGLGANALSAHAVRQIFAAKKRPAFNPVIVHLADASQLGSVARHVPPVAQQLAHAFWPGPLTLVLPRHAHIPDEVTAGLDGVGVRVPAHPVAHALIARAGVPIAAPSANPFTRISPTTAAHVANELGQSVPLILDGGPTTVGIESTVLDVTGDRPLLLRPGGLSRASIERVVGPIAVVAQGPDGDTPRPSPGMVERHYAPRAELQRLELDGGDEALARALQLAAHYAGRRVALVWRDEAELPARLHLLAPPPLLLPMPRDAEGYARALYAALHAIDDAGCRAAFVQPPPDDPAWDAVADRLRRAGLPPA